MLTTVTFGSLSGLRLKPTMVAANEKYLSPDELTFSIPEAYAGDIAIGMPVFFSWFPDIEFLITSIDIGDSTCDLRCFSTEKILDQRPAVPNIRSTGWKEAEYPDGWDFGDPEDTTDRIDIQETLDEIWEFSTTWYQSSGYNQGPIDLVSHLDCDFTRGITGSIHHYVADGTLYDCATELISMSTTRARLLSKINPVSDYYIVTFYTEPCQDRVRSFRISDFRSEVRSIKTSIDISDIPSTVIRANEDGVSQSTLYYPVRNYVTIETSESDDDSLGDMALVRSRLNQLVYEPYSNLAQAYTVEFEFHGELDLSGLKPGDTVLIDSTHPRPNWVPEELMITEIVRTFDHLGYREYPLLTTVPAVYGRDNTVTSEIKDTIRNFNAN